MKIQRDEQGRIYYDRPSKYAEKPIPVKFSKVADQVLRSMSDRSEYIRKAVDLRLEADALLHNDGNSGHTENI